MGVYFCLREDADIHILFMGVYVHTWWGIYPDTSLREVYMQTCTLFLRVYAHTWLREVCRHTSIHNILYWA